MSNGLMVALLIALSACFLAACAAEVAWLAVLALAGIVLLVGSWTSPGKGAGP
jgi:ABC-type amino acid transport substrate-binding protein